MEPCLVVVVLEVVVIKPGGCSSRNGLLLAQKKSKRHPQISHADHRHQNPLAVRSEDSKAF